MKKVRTLDLCYIALFVAIITVCSWISIPIGSLKYTLQVLGVLLCAGFLGWKRGLIAVFAYILLGAAGAPVFSNFTSGLFSSPTSGYIVGFLFTVSVAGLGYIAEYKSENTKRAYWLNLLIRAAFMVLGVALCYAFGTAWFMVYGAMRNGAVTLGYALSVCVVPYLWFDAIKIALALILVDRLKKYMK